MNQYFMHKKFIHNTINDFVCQKMIWWAMLNFVGFKLLFLANIN